MTVASPTISQNLLQTTAAVVGGALCLSLCILLSGLILISPILPIIILLIGILLLLLSLIILS